MKKKTQDNWYLTIILSLVAGLIISIGIGIWLMETKNQSDWLVRSNWYFWLPVAYFGYNLVFILWWSFLWKFNYSYKKADFRWKNKSLMVWAIFDVFNPVAMFGALMLWRYRTKNNIGFYNHTKDLID